MENTKKSSEKKIKNVNKKIQKTKKQKNNVMYLYLL